MCVGESSRTVRNGLVPQGNSSSALGLLFSDDVKKILNPSGPYWNWFFLGFYMISISLDSSFFYIVVIDGHWKCLAFANNLAFALVVFRTLFDIFHIIYLIFETDTDVPGKYMRFINAVLSILPLPSVVVFIVATKIMGGLEFETAINWLIYIVLFQYVPRAIRTYQLFTKATNRAGIFTVISANAAFYFLVFLIVSHSFGALWYFIAIERVSVCWREACKNVGCSHDSFCCTDNFGEHRILLNDFCPIKSRGPTVFYFGMFHEALQIGIVEMANFPQKFFYCFQWGIRSLCGSRIVWIIFIIENHCSECMRQIFRNMFLVINMSMLMASFVQYLDTSAYFWERFFSLVMTISGAVLISSLFENVQKLLQYYKEISERIRSQMREIEKWTLFQMLSNDLQQEIRNYHQTVWQAIEGFSVYRYFNELPRGISRKVKLQLCSPVLEKVFERIDERFLYAMLDLLKLVPYTEGSILVHEGNRVKEIFFIVRGKIWSQTTTINIRMFLFNTDNDGIFCGEELLPWASLHQLSGLPISSRTVTVTDDTPVEAFVIEAGDWEELVSNFMLPNDQLPYSFRFAQNFQTSTYAWECFFSFVMNICDAVLIASLLVIVMHINRNTQRIRLKMQEIENWRLFQVLSNNLKLQIRNYGYVCQETEDFNVYHFFDDLPWDLSWAMKYELCFSVLKKVPMFKRMDEQHLSSILDRFKLVSYGPGRLLVREGNPVNKLQLIIGGNTLSSTSNSRSTCILRPGNNCNFCGEELMPWAVDLQPYGYGFPISTRTVEAVTLVEAFSIEAKDLKEFFNEILSDTAQESGGIGLLRSYKPGTARGTRSFKDLCVL